MTHPTLRYFRTYDSCTQEISILDRGYKPRPARVAHQSKINVLTNVDDFFHREDKSTDSKMGFNESHFMANYGWVIKVEQQIINREE